MITTEVAVTIIITSLVDAAAGFRICSFRKLGKIKSTKPKPKNGKVFMLQLAARVTIACEPERVRAARVTIACTSME